MPSDLMRRLQPRKKMPKTTVSEHAHDGDLNHAHDVQAALVRSRPPRSRRRSPRTPGCSSARRAPAPRCCVARNRPATSVWLPSAGFIAGAGGRLGRRGSEGWEGGSAAETGELRRLTCGLARAGTARSLLFQSPRLVRVSPEPSRRAPRIWLVCAVLLPGRCSFPALARLGAVGTGGAGPAGPWGGCGRRR